MKIAEKKIQNEILLNVTKKIWIDGEITAAEFAREIGEKFSAVCVFGVTSIQTVIVELIGAYIDNAIC